MIALMLAFLITLGVFIGATIFESLFSHTWSFIADNLAELLTVIFAVSGVVTFALRTSWQWAHGLFAEVAMVQETLSRMETSAVEAASHLHTMFEDIEKLKIRDSDREREMIAIFSYLEGQAGMKLGTLKSSIE